MVSRAMLAVMVAALVLAGPARSAEDRPGAGREPRAATEEIRVFRRSFRVSVGLPAEVRAALRRFETYDYYQGRLEPFGDVIVVGNPWSMGRPGLFLKHTDGLIERLYWAETEASTWAWDPRLGLRKVPPCPGGCLSTEICLVTCPLKDHERARGRSW